MSDIWRMFPFPTLANESFTSGSLLDVHPDCRSCPVRECATATSRKYGEPFLCRFGLSYARIDPDRVVAGLVVRDLQSMTSRARKRLKRERGRQVTTAQVQRSIERVRELGPGIVDEFESNREIAIGALKADAGMQRAVAEHLRADADEDLSQSHDFMQMVKRIKGYSEALLAQRRPGIPPEEAAEQLHDEGAIFFATQLMVYKMNSLQYINEVNRAAGNESVFNIHPLILKYKRIYEWTAKQKGLRIHQGSNHSQVRYNAAAIGALVQALLDNMVKYSPPRAHAYIDFAETPSSVRVMFRSPGPRIEEDELEHIFVMKVRGKAARRSEDTGQGIGLATVKQISDALNLGVNCTQDSMENPDFPGFFMTTFEFELLTVV